ncbi:antitoxin Xre/MbcA/ParS toxin-binding domain-containing protein [Jiella avicenniae]|uniref:MbcA/ParS/Xre antitoxin family protein n=1 Tax=Jiella avicenniae TaxID=2907202 RepID=A0A9X1P5D7_9HYPH|nr:antitoxin Xre/MbcA/ParS toxin-binding domain-containing protein [Jiella avicenniae]MCE7030590.1 MbcA/ParS/Xre antitoxin family protein [Jiella avicenniae]
MPALELVHARPAEPKPAVMGDADAAAAARAVVNLFARWGLSDRDASILLGGIAPRSWARWKKGEPPKLTRDLCARLSNLLGIHKGLRIVFAEPERGYGWISRPNAAFGGRSALEVMRGGELTDLMRVRRYLDAERGGW